MIVRLAGQSSDARVLSTPVVLTTDNTEAKIVAAEQRPVVTSTSIQTTGQNTQNFEYRNIGININVTPRINPSGFVMMEIEQTADEVLSETTINNTPVPIIGKRELSAQVGVQSRQSVVLGGLVRTDNSKSRNKVPVLGDIPLLGWFFRADTKRRNRTELLVMLTPYVLKTPQEALDETQRLYSNSKNAESGWHKGWSDSPLPRGQKLTAPVTEPAEGNGSAKRKTLLDTFNREDADKPAPAQGRPLSEMDKPAAESPAPATPAKLPEPPPPEPELQVEEPGRPPSSAEDIPSAPVPLR